MPESAETIGDREAAQLARVHYNTVYECRNQLKALEREIFLAMETASRGSGVKVIRESKEKAIIET